MRVIVQRVIVPAAAVLAGIAALVYGAAYHATPVSQQELEEQSRQEAVTKTIRVPVPQGVVGGSSPWGDPEPEAGGPSAAPPGMGFITKKVQVMETVKRPVAVSKVYSARDRLRDYRGRHRTRFRRTSANV